MCTFTGILSFLISKEYKLKNIKKNNLHTEENYMLEMYNFSTVLAEIGRSYPFVKSWLSE